MSDENTEAVEADESSGAPAWLEGVEPTQDVGAQDGQPVPKKPGWPMLASVAVVVAALGLSLGLLREYSSIIAPMFMAINLLIAAYPVFTLLRRINAPRIVAASVTLLAVFVIFVLGILAIVWSVTEMVQALTAYSDQFVQGYTRAIEWLAQFGFDEAALLNSVKSISPSSVLDFAGSLVSGTSAATGLILVIVIALVFLSMDLSSMDERLQITSGLNPTLTRSLSAFASGVRRYWLVTTVFGLIVALLDGGVLLVLGIPLPLVWVVLSFITNYIPNVGFVIGLLPPALLALFEKGPITALIVVVAYCVLNFVIQSLIQPKFTGDAVGVTPTVSFLSLLLWASVFGPLGALIALPATLAVKALLIDPDPRMRWVNAFISNEPSGLADEHPRIEQAKPDHA